MDNLPGGEYEFLQFFEAAESGPFFIADAVLEARDKWLDLPYTQTPAQVQVVWNTSGEGSLASSNPRYIHLEGSENPDYGWPDTWDTDVIFHEYGHVIHRDFGFFDESTGGSHEWLVATTLAKASTEGFVTFLANVFSDSHLQHNTFNSFQDTGWTDSENGECNFDPCFVVNSVNNLGILYEGVVAGILWDIYDTQDDDYSTGTVWLQPNRYNPDGIGDTLCDGIDNILSALLDRTVDGHRPDNIEEFWEAWFQEPSFGHLTAMQDIWYEHGELKGCCVGITGNVDGDPYDVIDVGDLSYLIDYCFNSGPPPPCMEEADVDQMYGVDIQDVVILTAYMFDNGPAPAPCP